MVHISLNKHHGENACAQSGWQHKIFGCELVGSENDVSRCFWWLISDWARPLVCLLSQQHVLSLCVHSVLERTFSMDKIWKRSLYPFRAHLSSQLPPSFWQKQASTMACHSSTPHHLRKGWRTGCMKSMMKTFGP